MKDAANSPTRFGPIALDSPNPYNATIVPSSPDLEDLTSSTESFSSAINVSTTGTVKVYSTTIRVRKKAGKHRYGPNVPYRKSNMHCGRFLQSAQMPPLLAHRITNFQDVDSRTLFRPESDNGHGRIAKDVEFRDLGLDAVDYLSSGDDDVLSRLVVTAAEVKDWRQ
jgi:hypothetical protein